MPDTALPIHVARSLKRTYLAEALQFFCLSTPAIMLLAPLSYPVFIVVKLIFVKVLQDMAGNLWSGCLCSTSICWPTDLLPADP